MTSPLDEVCCARMPADGLALLAGLRLRPDVRVRLLGEAAWVRWPAGDEEVLRRILPVTGVELFERRQGLWYRPGHHLPAFGVPSEEEARPLLYFLSPAPVRAVPPDASEPRPVPLVLVRDDRPRPAAALLCSLDDLGRWADRATSRELESVRAARCGGEVLLLGERLPAVAGGRRFWGRRALVPLGLRAEPALTEGALCQVLGLGEDEVGLLTEAGVEAVPLGMFGPLTRAGVRLSLRGQA